MAIQLLRSHKGDGTLVVNGQPVGPARFGGIQQFPDGMCAVFVIPLSDLTFGETDNVVAFRPRGSVPPVTI